MTLFEFFFQPPQKEYLNAFPNRPLWLNWLLWNIRNPIPGLSILLKTDSMPGVSDWATTGGFKFVVHNSKLPFLSYRPASRNNFPWLEGYIGWRPDGSPGIALRRAYSKGY